MTTKSFSNNENQTDIRTTMMTSMILDGNSENNVQIDVENSTTLINNNNNKELPFPVPRKHSKFYIYYSTMGYIFQIVRDIDPKLRFVIDTFTLIGFVYSTRFVWTILSLVFILLVRTRY